MTASASEQKRTHVLILPSEEYLPPREFGAGIFQKHQIEALDKLDRFRIGVISVRLQYSVLMYARALAYALVGRRVDNALGSLSPLALVADGWRRLSSPRSFITIETERSYPVLRATGLYLIPPSPRFDPFWWVRAGLTAFEAYCERFGFPDVIHAHNTLNAGLLAKRISQRTGVPYVLTEHSSYYWQGLAPVALKSRVATAMRGAQAVLAVSEALRTSLYAWLGHAHRGGVSIDVLPNVLPTEYAVADGIARRPSGSPFNFLAIGNLLPVKGHDVLLRAFRQVMNRKPDCCLCIIGDGPLRGDLQQLCEELGIGDRVLFKGTKQPSAVREEMLSSDALVVSSHFETFGVVVIEAMSCGLPVVSTPCGGPQGLLTAESGLIAKAAGPVALAEAMMCMMDMHLQFGGAGVQSYAHARFGPRAIAESLASLYDDLARPPRSAAARVMG